MKKIKGSSRNALYCLLLEAVKLGRGNVRRGAVLLGARAPGKALGLQRFLKAVTK